MLSATEPTSHYLSQGIFAGETFNIVTVAVAVFALLVGLAGAVYQRRSVLPPKRRLTITAQRPTPLLSNESPVKGLSVRYNDTIIKTPHVVTLTIENTGKHDLSSAQFDQDRPVLIDLSAQIIKVLDIYKGPDGAGPKWTEHGSKIEIGPDLIRRGQRLEMQILTDGRPDVSCHGHLIDTKLAVDIETQEVRQRPVTRRSRHQRSFSRGPLIAITVAMLLTFSVVGTFFILNLDRNGEPRADPSITLSSDNPRIGSEIIMRGKDFYAGEPIVVTLECQENVQNSRIEADSLGEFVTAFIVPRNESLRGSSCSSKVERASARSIAPSAISFRVAV